MNKLGLAGAVFTGVGAWLLFLAYGRWVAPWLARRSIRKLLRAVESGKAVNPRPSEFAVSCNESGFTVSNNRAQAADPRIHIAWKEVRSITAFRRDLFIVDCICLFIATGDEDGIEVDEEMA